MACPRLTGKMLSATAGALVAIFPAEAAMTLFDFFCSSQEYIKTHRINLSLCFSLGSSLLQRPRPGRAGYVPVAINTPSLAGEL